MNSPLTTSSDRAMRKDLIRLRMEMHRQQLIYHSRPLAQPFHHMQNMMASRSHHDSGERQARQGRHPMLIVAMAALALFGRRLGKAGKLARLGLAVYPLVRKLR